MLKQFFLSVITATVLSVGASHATPTLTSPQGHSATVFPGQSITVTLSGITPGVSYQLLDSEGGDILSLFASSGSVASTTAPLPEGTYHFQGIANSTFTVSLYDIFHYTYPDLQPSYTLSGAGESIVIRLYSRQDANGQQSLIRSEDAWYDAYGPLSSWINDGFNPGWNPAFSFSLNCDEDGGYVELTVSAPLNSSGAARSASLGIWTPSGVNPIITQGIPPSPPSGDDAPEEEAESSFNPDLSTDRNWIVLRTWNTSADGSPVQFMDVNHYDGLGRAVQTILSGAGTDANGRDTLDVIQIHGYDFLGNTDREWLPYASPVSTGRRQGEADASAFANQRAFNAAKFHSDTCAVCSTGYEHSLGGRLLWQRLPGMDMQNTCSQKEYITNSSTNRLRKIRCLSHSRADGSISGQGYYAPGTLRGELSRDADGRVAIVWTDREGRTIAKDGYLYTEAGGRCDTTLVRTQFVYDIRGDIVWVISPEGSTRLETMLNTNPASTIRKDSEFASLWCWVYSRDGRRNITEKRFPGRAPQTFTYDSADRPVCWQDGRMSDEGRTLCYEYDSNGRLVTTYLRDDSGAQGDSLLVRRTDYNASTGLVDSELLLVVTPESWQDGPSSESRWYRRDYSYDRRGLVIGAQEYMVDASGDEVEDDGYCCRRYDAGYVYDLQGNLLQRTDSVWRGSTTYSAIVDFTYDRRGRACTETLSVADVRTASLRFDYDDIGLPCRHLYEANSEEPVTEILSFNEQGWPECSSSALFTERMEYTPAGKIDLLTCVNNGVEQSSRHSYDGLGRMTDGPVSYDLNGSITSIGGRTFTYNGMRRNGYSYDASGAVTYDPVCEQQIEWNFLSLPSHTFYEGRDEDIFYTYLADGTLLVSDKSDDSDVHVYAGCLVTDCDGELAEAVFSRGVMDYGTTRYQMKDHLGSVRVTFDCEGVATESADYSPYGHTSYLGRYNFAGKERQQVAGYLNFGARFYDPKTGFFLSPDPKEEQYFGINPYLYCGGDPVNLVDVNGLSYTDYFSPEGDFVYADGNDNGEIRIIENETANKLIEEGEDDNMFYANSALMQSAREEEILKFPGFIKIIEHYNTTGLPLIEQGNHEFGFFVYDGKPSLAYKKQKILNDITLNNYFNIQNAINAHEYKHYLDWKELADSNLYGAYSYKHMLFNTIKYEASAYIYQICHPTWKHTTDLYKMAIRGYMKDLCFR